MTERILLCVDDEASVLRSLKRLLRKEDYRVLTADSGWEGLALMEKYPVQVVVSDQLMPGMQGTEFLQQIKHRFPETVRVMLSGYAEVHAMLDSINKGEIYRFLPKPWNDDELKVILRQCFAQHDLIRENRAMIVQIQEQNDMLQRLNDDLERTVEERTQTLRFAQEIVEKLPNAVLGISREGFAALANEAARKVFAETAFSLGTDIDLFLPPEMFALIKRSLRGEPLHHDLLQVQFNGSVVRFRLITLGEQQRARGCMLLMEK